MISTLGLCSDPWECAMTEREHLDTQRDALEAVPARTASTNEHNQSALARYLAALEHTDEHEPVTPSQDRLYRRLQNNTVADVMTRAVVSVPADATFKQIVDVMGGHRIGAVPVVDEAGSVLGIVSTSDLLAKIVIGGDSHARIEGPRAAQETTQRKASAETAAELMTAPAVTARATQSVVDAARIAAAAHVRRLPVIDAHGQLVGIVARSDLLRVFRCDDAAIRAYLVDAVLARQLELDQLAVTVEVDDGVVTLRGEVDRKSRRASLVSAVRAVAGVTGVHD
ncbi:MAG TPA: CBS domain-containing protein, partial [Micromonosporaceae bacterium]